MRNIRKFVAPEIIFGVGALELVGRYAINFGANRVFIVTDVGIAQTGLLDRPRQILQQGGVDAVVYDQVSANPRDLEVMAGADLYQQSGADVIVALGAAVRWIAPRASALFPPITRIF